MRDLFTPPFVGELVTKQKRLRRELLEQHTEFIDTKIAILGGSTTHDICGVLELFLLHFGIRPSFYESEYAQYWQDAMFPNEALKNFSPDIIYICTSNRNISRFPELSESTEAVDELLGETLYHFAKMWAVLEKNYGCPIIQNNFEYPTWRLQGNRETSDIHGRVHFITRLNLKFAEYAQSHSKFYINDINYLSAQYGLEQWSDPYSWYMYKYALALPAIPYLAQSVANIIKSLYGKNKKAFALDLDNTLWGGVVGDDGPENLQIGQETPIGQAYADFQDYLKAHKQLGVILNIVSKNEAENAMAGLQRPDMRLAPEDFIEIRANWKPKSENLAELAQTLSLTPDSFVFVDDNPAERELVLRQVPAAAVPDIGDRPEHYVRFIDRMGYFEVTELSSDDAARTKMYRQNAERSRAEAAFENYEDYLRSLEMRAEIAPFQPLYYSRIAQLTNKSNQFNLTTRRYTQSDIEAMAEDEQFVTLSGKLYDKFGDNGVVSVVIGKKKDDVLEIILWLMSCRVLKRNMEQAMMDVFVERCREQKIKRLVGHYYLTSKNGMVREFYKDFGFSLREKDASGHTAWELNVEDYEKQNRIIKVNGKLEEE